MIKLLVFDWDDVIIFGSKKGYYDCYRKTIEELGIKLDERELDIRIQRKWGQPYREELKELIKEKPGLIDQACKIYQKHKYGETFISALQEIKGVNKILEKLSKKYKLAVCTANQRPMLKKIISKFSIPKVFCQIITSHDENIPAHKTKPDPFMLELILKEQSVKNTEALYIGDAKNDVLMAKNAKVEPVVVLTGHLNKQEALDLKVKYIIDNVTKIENVLNKL